MKLYKIKYIWWSNKLLWIWIYKHENLGYTRVKIGVNGCLWVIMDVLGSRGYAGTQKTNVLRKNDHVLPDLGPMAGKISPNIMFCKKKSNRVWTAPDECTCVRMGAVGCSCTGGPENNGKLGKTQRSVHVLQLWQREHTTSPSTTRAHH